jgi:hypothetical protein
MKNINAGKHCGETLFFTDEAPPDKKWCTAEQVWGSQILLEDSFWHITLQTRPLSAVAKILSCRSSRSRNLTIQGSRRLLRYPVWCGKEDQSHQLTLAYVLTNEVACFPSLWDAQKLSLEM